MLLKSGRAELVTEGRLAAPVEIVSALDDMLRLSVAGPSRCALRVLPGGKGLALSAYDGAPEAVALRRMDDSAAFAAGRNVDGLLFPADPNLEKKRAPFVLWPDVTAALPPVTDGEVLLQLTNGRVLRGRVTAQTAQSVQLFGTWAGTSLTGLASGPAKVPESILAAEVAAWTPAETPRGRDTYARWLDERLPKQLEEAKRNWFVILSAAPNPDFYPYELISAEHLLPEVEYRVQRRGQERLFQIVPLDKDLGPGWEMDERGLPARIGATAPAARDADF
jgi:hypothetical protein